MKKRANKPARTWPKMTPYQRNLLRLFADSTYGDLHIGTGHTLSLWRLRHEGMIEGGTGGWWSITQRGRDFIRALRQKEIRKRKPKPKFHVGQVVAVRGDRGWVKLIKRPREEFIQDDAVYVLGGKDLWYSLSELRPLTRRERGRQTGGK